MGVEQVRLGYRYTVSDVLHQPQVRVNTRVKLCLKNRCDVTECST